MPTYLNYINYPSPNFNKRPKGSVIDKIILHATAIGNTQASLKRLTQTDTENRVSSHYLVSNELTEGGCDVYVLVVNEDRAWHAGLSAIFKETNLNDTSLAIETECGAEDHDEEKQQPITFEVLKSFQIDALAELLKSLMQKFNISAHNIYLHRQVSLGRKSDPYPGPLFKQLSERGIEGLWYDEKKVERDASTLYENQFVPSKEWIKLALQDIGYPLSMTENIETENDTFVLAVQDFQRTYIPSNYAGRLGDFKFGKAIHTEFFQNSLQASLDSRFYATLDNVVAYRAPNRQSSDLQTMLKDRFQDDSNLLPSYTELHV